MNMVYFSIYLDLSVNKFMAFFRGLLPIYFFDHIERDKDKG